VVKLLVENGADRNAVDKCGKTALVWAEENHRTDVVQYLKAIEQQSK
jgi:hypothetical protein